MNALIRLLTSSTTFWLDSLASAQLDKHSRSYASIWDINAFDSL